MVKTKYCRFISVSDKLGWHDSFMIENGGTIYINGKETSVDYINDEHFLIGYRCYHIAEFFKDVVLQSGCVVLPGKGLKTQNYSRNYLPYMEDTYDFVLFPDIEGKVFEFSNMRIVRETLPLGRYAYEVRHDDDGMSTACSIAEKVLVNHLGTIISDEPLLDQNQKFIYLENDMIFIDNLRREQACH